MTAPSMRPETPVAAGVPVVLDDDITRVVAPETIVLPDTGSLPPLAPLAPPAPAPAPPAPAHGTAPETHAPRAVTLLVALGLLIVGGGVLLAAMGHDNGVLPRAHVPAGNAAVVRAAPQPTNVHVLGAQRTGDAVLMRVDPIGNDGVLTLVVEPGATVTLGRPLGTLTGGTVILQDFLDAASAPAVHQAQFALRYDNNGAVRSITLPAGG